MTKKKVLIVYATGGMGHVTAAKAVEEAFTKHYPEVEIKNVDIISFANPFYKKIFVDGYNWISAKKPNWWGWLYRSFNDKSKQKLPSLISRWAISPKFIPFIQEYKPDFIVSTHPLPMILVSYSKHKDVIEIQSSMVVTDFGCHSFWVDKEVNYYFVATEEVAMCLGNYGVRRDQIVVTGIPVFQKFSEPVEKTSARRSLGLAENIPTLLIVGGQFDFAALNTIIGGIRQKHEGAVQFLVVAGRDKYLQKELERSGLDKEQYIKVFGFVDNMEVLMSAADLIFSKAGGLTVSECLAKGLPMVINKVIPGQEEDNVNYLVAKNAAVKADDFSGIVTAVNTLLDDPQQLAAMQLAAKKIGHPNSATELADFVVKK